MSSRTARGGAGRSRSPSVRSNDSQLPAGRSNAAASASTTANASSKLSGGDSATTRRGTARNPKARPTQGTYRARGAGARDALKTDNTTAGKVQSSSSAKAARERTSSLRKSIGTGDQSWRTPENAAQAGSGYKERMHELWQQLKSNREQERKAAIRDGLLADPDRPRSLKNAITVVGTCQDMCPEYERVERIVQLMVDPCEKVKVPGSDTKAACEDLMVKRFRRSAAGYDEQLPSDIRPPLVLQRTLNYLLDDVVGGPEPLATSHKFVWDRTRGIRNDFSIQQVTNVDGLRIAIDCFERIARFHLLALHQLSHPTRDNGEFDHHQEREQLNKTLLSLMYYYDDSRHKLTSPNEAEFRAYTILFEIQDRHPDLEDRAQSWPAGLLQAPRVQTALRLYAAAGDATEPQGPLQPRAPFALAQCNFGRFWDVISSRTVPYLMACAAEIYFHHVRSQALQSIYRAYRAGALRTKMEDLVLEDLVSMLGFDDEDQVQRFVEDHGFVIGERADGRAYVDLASVSTTWLKDVNPGRKQLWSRHLVERKRHGRAFRDVLNGLSVAECRRQGLIDDDMSDVSDAEGAKEENSLFLREPGATTNNPSRSPSPLRDTSPAPPPAVSTHQPTQGNPFSGRGQAAFNPSANPFIGLDQTASNPPLNPFTGLSQDTSISTANPFTGLSQPPPNATANPFAALADSSNSKTAFDGFKAPVVSNPFAAKPPPSNPFAKPTAPESEKPAETSTLPNPQPLSTPPAFNFGQPTTIPSGGASSGFSLPSTIQSSAGGSFPQNLSATNEASPFSNPPTGPVSNLPLSNIDIAQKAFSNPSIFQPPSKATHQSAQEPSTNPIHSSAISTAPLPASTPAFSLTAASPTNASSASILGNNPPLSDAASPSAEASSKLPSGNAQSLDASVPPSTTLVPKSIPQGLPSTFAPSLKAPSGPFTSADKGAAPPSIFSQPDPSSSSSRAAPSTTPFNSSTSTSQPSPPPTGRSQSPLQPFNPPTFSRNTTPPSSSNQSSAPSKPSSPSLSFPSSSSPAQTPKSTPESAPYLESRFAPKTSPSAQSHKGTSSPSSPSSVSPRASTRRRSQVQPRKTRQSAYDTLARNLTAGPGGVLEQFLDFVIESLVVDTAEQFQRDQERIRGESARADFLRHKYGRKWKQWAWQQSLRRRGQQMRQSMRQSLLPNSTSATSHRPSQSPLARVLTSEPTTNGLNGTKSSNAVTSDGGSKRHPDLNEERPEPNAPIRPPMITKTDFTKSTGASVLKSAERARLSSSAPARSAQSHAASSSRSLPAAGKSFGHGLTRSARVEKIRHRVGEAAAALPRSRAFLDPEIVRQARNLVTGRTDQTHTDYFRLKAMGIDPDTGTVSSLPRRTPSQTPLDDDAASAHSYDSRVSSTGFEHLSAKTRELLMRSRHGSTEPSPKAPSLLKEPSSTPVREPNQNLGESLSDQIRKVREALAEGESWFREERARLEDEDVRSARQRLSESPAERRLREWQPTPSRTSIRLETTGAGGLWDRAKLRASMRESAAASRSDLMHKPVSREASSSAPTLPKFAASSAALPRKALPTALHTRNGFRPAHVVANGRGKSRLKTDQTNRQVWDQDELAGTSDGNEDNEVVDDHEEEENDEEEDEGEEEEYSEDEIDAEGVAGSHFYGKGASAADAIEL